MHKVYTEICQKIRPLLGDTDRLYNCLREFKNQLDHVFEGVCVISEGDNSGGLEKITLDGRYRYMTLRKHTRRSPVKSHRWSVLEKIADDGVLPGQNIEQYLEGDSYLKEQFSGPYNIITRQCVLKYIILKQKPNIDKKRTEIKK